MPRCLLTIGTLKSIDILDPETGRTRTMRFSKRWLAWDAKKKNFVVCKVFGSASNRVTPKVGAKHRSFHNAPPNGTMRGDAPTPAGALKELGLAKGLTYEVPRTINSPEKNPHIWHHAFGDTGHRGGSYSPRVMPGIAQDAKGNIFFIRRPGNIYKVDTWLRG